MTTSRLTHATPAAAFAHTPERDWEGDVDMEDAHNLCKDKVKDITAQLIEDNPSIKVSWTECVLTDICVGFVCVMFYWLRFLL